MLPFRYTLCFVGTPIRRRQRKAADKWWTNKTPVTVQIPLKFIPLTKTKYGIITMRVSRSRKDKEEIEEQQGVYQTAGLRVDQSST